MIAFIQGKLAESLPTRITIDVNGIGYEIIIPLSTFDKLPPPGNAVKVLTHLQVREDDHTLYGFFTKDERDLFKLLINHVTGIGPKLAITLLSGCSPDQLRTAVIQNDIPFLSRIKGLGKKTAERIVMELRDKVGVSEAWAASSSATLSPQQQQQNDALLALISLGYKQADALKALKELPSELTTEEIVREALKKI